MIASLNGTIELRSDPYLIIDVGGVGYKVLACSEVLSKINQIGGGVKLFTYTHVREDALELYGFGHFADLKLFEMLIGVSGVGPKTAMSIFSIGSRSEIVNAIVKGDVEFFTSVPRLGKKNAQKIIIELKSKLGSDGELDLSEKDLKENKELTGALRTFGFTEKEASEAVKALKGQGDTIEQKIKLALKYLGR